MVGQIKRNISFVKIGKNILGVIDKDVAYSKLLKRFIQ